MVAATWEVSDASMSYCSVGSLKLQRKYDVFHLAWSCSRCLLVGPSPDQCSFLAGTLEAGSVVACNTWGSQLNATLLDSLLFIEAGAVR